MLIKVRNRETCIQAIKSIGQDLINKAEDITNDIDSIYANINPLEVVSFDVTKNYVVKFQK